MNLLEEVVEAPCSRQEIRQAVLAMQNEDALKVDALLAHLFPRREGSKKGAEFEGKSKDRDGKDKKRKGAFFAGYDSELETEVAEAVDEGSSVNFDYSIKEEEILARNAYGPTVDVEKLWYGEVRKAPPEYQLEGEGSWGFAIASETEAISTEEAGDLFVKIQYEAACNAVGEVSNDDRRKFDLWIKFNRALFGLFESTQAFTNNVNYGPLR